MLWWHENYDRGRTIQPFTAFSYETGHTYLKGKDVDLKPYNQDTAHIVVNDWKSLDNLDNEDVCEVLNCKADWVVEEPEVEEHNRRIKACVLPKSCAQLKSLKF